MTSATDWKRMGWLRLANLRADLRLLRDRLAETTIEQLAYAECIRRYDGPETLFYLDPPYVGCKGDYGEGFDRADFEHILRYPRNLKGRFVLSINDTPLAHEVFGAFRSKRCRSPIRSGPRTARDHGPAS